MTDEAVVGKRFAQLELAGPDAAAFLQGYLTADLDDLNPGSALPTACCNLKGRVVASGWVAGEAARARLLLAATAVPAVIAHLGKYLLFSKSKLTVPTTGLRFAPASSPGAFALPPTGWHATFDAPADAPADPGDAEFAAACATAGFVTVGPLIADAFLPQMVGLTAAGAVSFAKGCYLGQEVVARAEHRGQVKQLLRTYRATGPLPPVGADVLDGHRKIGMVAATAPELVLAVTRSDAANVVAGGARLTLAPKARAGHG